MIRKIILIIILLTIIFLLSNCTIHAQVTKDVLDRVLFISYGNHAGSAFTIEINEQQYIITARHNVENIREEDNIFIYHDFCWKDLKVKTISFDDPKFDVIVLVPDFQITPKTDIKFTMDNLIIGQDIYFLGFPFGLKTELGELNSNFPIPFVKKGICSAIDFTDKEFKKIWIDGLSNPGFSGGPIIFKDCSSGNFKIAGLLQGHLTEKVDIYSSNNINTNDFVKINSGIILGISIGSIIDKINRTIKQKENVIK
jgi:hypothetical protein